MRCEQISPYLPGYAGGDLRQDTQRLVTQHVASCARCREEAGALGRVTAGLSTLAGREIPVPAALAESIVEAVGEHRHRRLVPMLPPAVAPDLVRLVQDNRDAIASAGATALVAAGAAYALWRAVRGRRATTQPATS